jgi:low temperature requirement protein LtrA
MTPARVRRVIRTPHTGFLRGNARVSAVELFFDLVYVFAVTQLSHRLVEHPTVDGALQTAVLLAMVWQAWVYTTW